jgi:hypothetical protein
LANQPLDFEHKPIAVACEKQESVLERAQASKAGAARRPAAATTSAGASRLMGTNSKLILDFVSNLLLERS